jgi:hypothetical protein
MARQSIWTTQLGSFEILDEERENSARAPGKPLSHKLSRKPRRLEQCLQSSSWLGGATQEVTSKCREVLKMNAMLRERSCC